MRTVHVEDGVASPLEMLPILPPPRMADLLAAELAALGFERDGDRCKRVEPDGIEITVDLAAATVSVRIAAGAKLEEVIEVAARVDSDHAEAHEHRMRDQAKRDLDARLTARTEELRQEVTARLENKLADLQRELDGAVGRATVAALTEKAAQLGRIEETSQDEAGNVMIRVRL